MIKSDGIKKVLIAIINESFWAYAFGGVMLFLGLPFIIWYALHFTAYVEIPFQIVAAIACIPFGGMLAWSASREFSGRQIPRTILAYVFAAISFAGIYYGMYYRQPNTYSFSTGILTESEQSRLEFLTNRVRLGYRRYGHFSNLRLWVNSKSESEFNALLSNRVIGKIGDMSRAWQLPEGIEVLHYYVVIPEVPSIPVLVLKDKIGKVEMDGSDNVLEAELVNHLVLIDKTKPEYLESLSRLESLELSSIQSASHQLRTLNPSNAFSLFDFFYFSLITVTTVGYGDIVPNSTIVRMIVVGQILFGLMLIINASGDKEQKAQEK